MFRHQDAERHSQGSIYADPTMGSWTKVETESRLPRVAEREFVKRLIVKPEATNIQTEIGAALPRQPRLAKRYNVIRDDCTLTGNHQAHHDALCFVMMRLMQ